jgi:hypothetical protein
MDGSFQHRIVLVRIGRPLIYDRRPGFLGLLNESDLIPNCPESQVPRNSRGATPGAGRNIRTILLVVYLPYLDKGIYRDAIIASRGIKIWALVHLVSSRISVVHTIRVWRKGGSVKITHEILGSRANRARGTARVKAGREDLFRGLSSIEGELEKAGALPDTALRVVRAKFTRQLLVFEVVGSINHELMYYC